jgi:hypothetical protein
LNVRVDDRSLRVETVSRVGLGFREGEHHAWLVPAIAVARRANRPAQIRIDPALAIPRGLNKRHRFLSRRPLEDPAAGGAVQDEGLSALDWLGIRPLERPDPGPLRPRA